MDDGKKRKEERRKEENGKKEGRKKDDGRCTVENVMWPALHICPELTWMRRVLSSIKGALKQQTFSLLLPSIFATFKLTYFFSDLSLLAHLLLRSSSSSIGRKFFLSPIFSLTLSSLAPFTHKHSLTNYIQMHFLCVRLFHIKPVDRRRLFNWFYNLFSFQLNLVLLSSFLFFLSLSSFSSSFNLSLFFWRNLEPIIIVMIILSQCKNCTKQVQFATNSLNQISFGEKDLRNVTFWKNRRRKKDQRNLADDGRRKKKN